MNHLSKKTFEETINILKEVGLIYDNQIPRLPDTMPRYDDIDPCGFSIFRAEVKDVDLSNLDMRRTFFSRSEIAHCSFKNTDLEESNLCWNDFINVDFSNANLSNSDLRASIYENVNFTECNLSGSDLRKSDFNHCNFTSANMKAVKLTKTAVIVSKLTIEQKNQIDWQDTEGCDPGGG